MNPEQLLCKDCQHSQASWLARTFNRSYGWNCELGYREPKFNPVNGQSTAGYYDSCAVMRIDRKVCGPAATAWQPRTKKDLFALLRVVR